MLSAWHRRSACSLGALFILSASCSTESTEHPAERAVALAAVAPAAFQVAKGDPTARCQARVSAALRAAARERSSEGPVARKLNEEVVGYQSGSFSGTCALASGWVSLHDTRNFAQYREGAKEPNQADIHAAARAAIQALDADGVIEGAQLDWENVQYGTTEVRGGEGYGQPEVGPFYVQTRMTVPRKIDGVPVVGNGVKVTVDAQLRVVAIQIFWRALEKAVASTPVTKTLDGAFSELTRRSSVEAGHVLRKALAYVDSGVRSSQEYLEPWYVFETKASPSDKRHLHLVDAIAGVRSPDVRANVEGFLESDRGGLR